MLVIPEEIKEYFQEVEEFAEASGIMKIFDRDMLRLHLYGCSWESPDKCRITLGKDFAPYSFTMLIEKLTPEGNYAPTCSGGVIFHGPHDGFGSGAAPTFSVSLDNTVGWQMHT